jgi:hypothetical protein
MNANAPIPTDRASFDRAMTEIRADHATLRHLATAVSEKPRASADNVMSLVDAMAAHESAETRLFALPFLTRPPETVTATGTQARRRCIAYRSGALRVDDPAAAATLVVDALLAHLAVEDAWLAQEEEQHHQRLLKSI